MKLDIEYDLGSIVITTDPNHGNPEGVFIDGIDVTDMTVTDMVLKVIGVERWMQMVSKAADGGRDI